MKMVSENEDTVPDALLVHKATPEYLQELLKDKKQLQSFPNTFVHLEIILEKEISRVREKLFHLNASSNKSESELPEANGPITTLQEKVFVPVKENPNYNFVGRLLGPRGLTAKQLEQDLECKIMVRGRGSLRDKKKEDMNRGKPNWEHLEEELHVLVSVEDFESRAGVKLRRATETIRAFLEQGVRTPENEDRLKQLQLMELAVLNDKDRQQAHAQQQLQQQQQSLILQHQHTLTTVLNSQAAAAAAAAAAQLMGQTNPATLTAFPSGQQQMLARYQSGALSPLSAASALGAGSTGSPGSLLTAGGIPTAIASSPGVQPTYSSVPTNLLCSLSGGLGVSSTGVTSASSTGWPVGAGATNGLGFHLAPQFQVAASVPSLTALSYPTVQNSVSSNLINCTPSAPAGQDPLAAITAALLTAGTGSSVHTGALQLSNGTSGASATGGGASGTTNQRLAVAAVAGGKAVQQQQQQQQQVVYQGPESNTSSTVGARQLLDPTSLLDYQNAVAGASYELSSESLKLRSIPSGSANSQTRMHPYVRQ